MRITFATGLLIFLFLVESYSQDFDFTNYSIDDGLSQSVVNCLFQDSKGYIWIGTQNGLNRFNGETFDVFSYNPFDSCSISNNWIYALAEDHDGNLWIGTKGGLNKYFVRQNKFLRLTFPTGFTHDVSQYIYDVACLKNGNILINTPPVISICNPETNRFSNFQNQQEYDGAVKDVRIPVLEDEEGDIWVGSTKGLSRFSPASQTFRSPPFHDKQQKFLERINITALCQDNNGTVWVGTTSGLFSNGKDKTGFQETGFFNGSIWVYPFENQCIRTILEDKNGNMIIGTEGSGLYVLPPNGLKPNQIRNFTSQNSNIGHNIVQSLIIDRSENLWIGTLQGMSKTDLKPQKFVLYRKRNSPNSTDLLGNVIASLYKDDDGLLWVGNWGQGLNLIDRSTNRVEHFSTQMSGNHKIDNDFIHVIFKDSEKRIWLGTRNGILIYDRPGHRFIPWTDYFKIPDLPSLLQVRIYMIIQDRSSIYWIGTQNGVYKIDLNKPSVEVFQKELDPHHRLSANLIYHLMEDSDGLIWMATISGLDVYNPVTRQIRHFRKERGGLSDDFIISLCEDRHGRIWIGTGSYVNVFNKVDSTFTYYSQEQGLPNNRIFEILKDHNNDLWLATGKGLCKFDEKQNNFRTFTIEDGLQSLEFNLRAACVCGDGELLLGGMDGFNSFYPDSISGNPYVPNLVFTSFYKTKGTKKSYVNISALNEIVIDHQVNSFTVEFAALEYTNPQKNQYMYQMSGLSDEWVDIGNRKFVPFSGLRPGDYTFKIRGSNNDGVWNQNEISLNIVVQPPWWLSSYALAVYVFLIVLSVVFFIKIRERKLKHDKKLLEEKVRDRTLQIEEQNRLIVSKNQELKELNVTKDKFFSIIGHDLRNQFNIIIGFLALLISDYKKLDAEKINHHLTNIYNSSVHAHELLENLLTWAQMQTGTLLYSPVNFDVVQKMNDTLQLLEGAAARKNIKIDFSFGEEVLVYADANMFSTVFRNLVANAIKFSFEKGSVVVQLEQQGDFCEIAICDQGVGIPKGDLKKLFRVDCNHSTLGTSGEKGTGLGLILCREFVGKNGGTITVESEEGKGSRFIFTLPVKKLS